jgi:ferrochelatase
MRSPGPSPGFSAPSPPRYSPAVEYQAFLLLSFGGPEKREDVIPFLENVLRGKNVPRERMLDVAEHYYHFDGKSPINGQVRELIAALRDEFSRSGISLPIYWGNRNWHPLLPDTLREMRLHGVERAIAFVTSAYGSYSGCRQYLEDIDRARGEVAGIDVHKLRAFFNHPGFVETMVDRVRDAFQALPEDRRAAAPLVYTAHSIPVAMSDGSPYLGQLRETCRLVSEALGRSFDGAHDRLVWQSRSGPPGQPWLEPDISSALRDCREAGSRDAVVVPIGFISDHMEVLYDLDTEAAALSSGIGLNMVRAKTAGSHPRFVRMIRELVEERLDPDRPRLTAGLLPPAPDSCEPSCCPRPARPGAQAPTNRA